MFVLVLGRLLCQRLLLDQSCCSQDSLASLAGIEPTGNMVKKRAEFTVETISAGQGEVLVYVEDPAGHREEVK